MDHEIFERKSNITGSDLILSDKIYGIIKKSDPNFNSPLLLNFRLSQLASAIRHGKHIKWKKLSR